RCRGRRSTCGRGPPRDVAYERARRPRRSTRFHAGLRPRARGGARAGGSRRGARDVAFPLRRSAGSRGIRAERALLPDLLATLRTVPAAVAAEGGRARPRPRPARPPPRGRPPSPVARRARARRALPTPREAVGLHGARPAAAAHRREAGALAPAARPLRPDRRAQ